jgi:hypothetical protein
MRIVGYVVLALGGFCWGLDTTESFEIGFSDLEFYSEQNGFHGKGTIHQSNLFLGFGLTRRLSAGIEVAGNTQIGEDAVLSGYVFFNALQEGHFSTDLIASFVNDHQFDFSIESNLDFSRGGIQITISEQYTDVTSGLVSEKTYSICPLFSFNLSQKVQFLMELDLSDHASHTEHWEKDCLCTGLNYTLNESVEIISQLDYLSGPESQWGVSLGCIISLK